MKQLQKQKENKASILEDMLSFITYMPNREADILAFMGQYQKADAELRPSILECLRSCMDGNKYPNPYAESYRYTAEDVSVVDEILDSYTENIAATKGNPLAISECVQVVVCRIKELNDQCGGSLIDTWRRERLCEFIYSAAETEGFQQETDPTLAHRMW